MIDRLAIAVAAVAVGLLVGWALRRRPRPGLAAGQLFDSWQGLTLFTAPYCSRCTSVQALLHEGDTPWREMSVVEHPEVIRLLDIRTAPTIIATDAHGRVVDRIAGPCSQDRIHDAARQIRTSEPGL